MRLEFAGHFGKALADLEQSVLDALVIQGLRDVFQLQAARAALRVVVRVVARVVLDSVRRRVCDMEDELLGNWSPLDVVDACFQAIEDCLGEVFASICFQCRDEFLNQLLVRKRLHQCDILLFLLDMMVSVGYESEFY